MPNRMIVYVDGFNLYHGIHQGWRCKYLWLDLVKLSQSLRSQNQLVKVKYFTASVLNNSGAQSRQDNYIVALKAAYPSLIEVMMGRYQSKQQHCNACGSTWTTYEEKETDVNIAVSIVADAASHAADSFVIISADSDLAPAIRTARRINPLAFFMAAFPPNRYSNELKTLMPSSLQIGRSKISQSALPASVPGSAPGVSFDRPSKWS
jgi:uncharacterized LabA/DUF88 family protein